MKKALSVLLLALCLIQPVQAQFIGYLFVERLNLTDAQTATLIEGLKTLGRANDSPCPNLRNHWRVRPDQNAIIVECEFDDSTISAEAVKNRLATLFGVNPTLVTYTTAQTAYGPAVTYRYANQNRVRFGVFGGLTATWRESWAAAIAYLKDNQAAWEPAN